MLHYYNLIQLVLLVSALLHPFQRVTYPADEIPEALLNNAVAVVRTDEITMDIQSIDKAVENVNYAVTILEKTGDDFGIFNELYDNLQEISDIRIVLYDAEGKIIEKVKASDIKDYSSNSGYSVFEDDRQKYYMPQINKYPYTVEYHFSRTFKGLLNYPVWQPVTSYDLSVQRSSFKVTAPPDLKVRYFESNIDNKGKIYTEGNRAVYEWSLVNYPAVEKEDHSPFLFEITPLVETAPSRFKIEGYEGSMNSWEDFGKWSFQLIQGRDVLPKETVEEILRLVSGAKDDKEKIRRIYGYMQAKTRYVSIQEGIGGWQPMYASLVDKLGYGDCKALSNYTMSLLKIAGIKSYYTRVRAGRNEPDLNKDFISNQFNHIILCVPLENDTIWLECTDQTSPFGYLGGSTCDRDVFIISPSGGRIARTTLYPAEASKQINTAYIKFKSPDFCTADISSRGTGLQYENFSELINKSYDEKKKWIYDNTGLANIEVLNFSIRSRGEEKPEVIFRREIGIRNLASKTGKRLFIPLNLLNRINYIPVKDNNRINNIVIRNSFLDLDSITLILPEGYKLEASPSNPSFKSTFGEYNTNCIVKGDSVLFTRRLKMNKGNYPASAYEEFRQYYTDISNSDNVKLVLVEKQ